MFKLNFLSLLFLANLLFPVSARLIFAGNSFKTNNIRSTPSGQATNKNAFTGNSNLTCGLDNYKTCASVAINGSFSTTGLFVKQDLAFYSDTVIVPATDTTPNVAVSNAIQQRIEFTPFSRYFNGGFIQPVNRATNKGISTSFYLKDTSSWIFYTNATQRLLIQGDGKIVTSSHLLINNAAADNESALRVNGIARVDTSVMVRAVSDVEGFVSMDRNVKSINDPDDGVSPYTFTPTQWANGGNIPGLRIRHPLNVTGRINTNKSIFQDFVIVPYQYGTAIQFNGVVECWVGEWSVHRGNFYYDVEAKGNGWGGVLWVGDDNDLGGIRATARNNQAQGGNVTYGELSAEKFGGAGFGDFRLRLPSTDNVFQFVYGERGSNNVFAKISSNGLFIPKVSSETAVTAPEKAQIMYDSMANQFKGYNGTQWVNFSDNGFKTGTSTMSTDGFDKVFLIPHGLTATPSYFNVLATSADAANISYVSADASNLIIHYVAAPHFGSNNLSWNWQIKK